MPTICIPVLAAYMQRLDPSGCALSHTFMATSTEGVRMRILNCWLGIYLSTLSKINLGSASLCVSLPGPVRPGLAG